MSPRTEKPPRLFTTKEACEVAGITERQADHWVRIGQVLAPSSTPWTGSGIHRRWTVEEVRVLAILGVLAAAHAPMTVMAIAATALLENDTPRKGDSRWLVCGEDWAAVVKASELAHQATSALWFIPLKRAGDLKL